MSIPKEPRQIMINLMYLVLTALLALNVSNEILNAFKTLSSSIDKSNRSIDAKTNELYAAIIQSEAEKGQADKVKPFRLKADEVVKRSNEMVAYLNSWKKRIVMEAGGYGHEDSTMPDKMDNIDATTSLLVEKKGGDTVKSKILEMRKFLLSMLPPSDTASYRGTMPLGIEMPKPNDHNPTGDWSVANFEHMPAVAALALFSKYQNDVRSSENMVIKKLSELAHARDLKFDTMAAVAVPKTTYALKGDKIEAQIILAAFNKTNKPSISIAQGGGQHKDAVNGVISWETIADGVGLQTVKGRVTLETAEQGTISRDWSFDYMVGTTGASLQLDKMNVFYIGVPNPVTVSAAGYALEDVYLNLPAGVTAVPNATEKGKFDITCALSAKGNISVDIMAKSKEKDGAAKKVASIPIRVKVIPDPVAYVLDKRDGTMPSSLFRDGALGPRAVLEKFEFDTKFVITEFKYSMIPKKGGEYIGPYTASKPGGGCLFSDSKEIEKVKGNCKPGDRVFIEQIKAKGPDGQIRPLNPIILTLN